MAEQTNTFQIDPAGRAVRFSVPVRGRYLYLAGGYSTFDHGCPSWGTADKNEISFVGDRAGEIRLLLADGSILAVPLIFGYTMWFRINWMDGGAPFKTKAAKPEAEQLLRETLHLRGGFEAEKMPVLRIDISGLELAEVRIMSDPGRKGEPIFTGGCVTEGPAEPIEIEICKSYAPVLSSEISTEGKVDETLKVTIADDDFYHARTVSASEPVPAFIQENLRKMRQMLYTAFGDIEKAGRYEFPDVFPWPRIRFAGTPEAEIATGVYAENILDMRGKIDAEGFFHTSTLNAPSWRYDGFGTYVPESSSYFSKEYSRDAGRGLMSLLGLGGLEPAAASIEMLDRDMMSLSGRTLGGKPIPGHWTVMPNLPDIYLGKLIKHNWPTQYTPDLFGDEWQNIGNLETDGHGLMLMANLLYLRAKGDSSERRRLFPFISEAVEFIKWSLDNPELSFAKDDVLYGETEAAMNAYTLYANIPNHVGLKLAIELAESLGEAMIAEDWRVYLERLEAGIDRYFGIESGEGERWDYAKRGFLHETTVTMFADSVGWDPAGKLPRRWFERSRATYAEDIAAAEAHEFFAPAGLGYDHNNITQSALLLDMAADYTRLAANLSRLCYAPRLPSPYIVPEGASVNLHTGEINRQGDLGNLVQQAETLKTYQIIAGIFTEDGDRIKIMPRLPAGWSVAVEGYPVMRDGKKCTVSYSYDSKVDAAGKLRCEAHLDEERPLSLRMGPFDMSVADISVKINGGPAHTVATFVSGDSRWAWLDAAGKDFIFETV